jgi:hypothetical protein
VLALPGAQGAEQQARAGYADGVSWEIGFSKPIGGGERSGHYRSHRGDGHRWRPGAPQPARAGDHLPAAPPEGRRGRWGTAASLVDERVDRPRQAELPPGLPARARPASRPHTVSMAKASSQAMPPGCPIPMDGGWSTGGRRPSAPGPAPRGAGQYGPPADIEAERPRLQCAPTTGRRALLSAATAGPTYSRSRQPSPAAEPRPRTSRPGRCLRRTAPRGGLDLRPAAPRPRSSAAPPATRNDSADACRREGRSP